MTPFTAFAYTPMGGNLILAAVVLGIGMLLLRSLSAQKARSNSQFWIPIAALIAGPVLATAYWAIDAFVVSPDNYVQPSDYTSMLIPVVAIGTFVGLVAWLALAIAYRVRRRDDEQETKVK